jgi:hypothetical protein
MVDLFINLSPADLTPGARDSRSCRRTEGRRAALSSIDDDEM